MVRAAQESWPGVEVDPVAFIAHTGVMAGRGDGADAWLEHGRPSDLWLAFACVSGSRLGIEAFERAFEADIRRALDRYSKTTGERDDLRQTLFDKLFVGSDTKPPKLASYAGIGFLQNWVRVTATRTFLDVWRRKNATVSEVPLDEALSAHGDFEVGFLKHRYRDVFKAAFAEATAELDPTERNLLRRRLEGLNVDQIGVLEGVHRSTAARRLEKARHSLLQRTRSKLGEHLGVEHSELDSVMKLAQTLDVSLERLLNADSDKEASDAATDRHGSVR